MGISDIDRIVLDGLNLRLKHGTGIATYAANLARLLQKMQLDVDVVYDRRIVGKADRLKRELSFFTDLPRRRGGRFRRSVSRVAEIMPWAIDVARGPEVAEIQQEIVLPRETLPNHPDGAGILSVSDLFRKASAKANLFNRPLYLRLPAGSALHLTSPVPIVAKNGPTILTVHDIVPLRLPYAVIDPDFRFLKQLRVIAARVNHIITVSESAKQDLLRVIPLPPENITVTYQPVRPFDGFVPEMAAEVVSRVYDLTPGEYFLFVGAIEPKKNLSRLIDAYLLSGAERPLVIVGPDGWAVKEQLAPMQGRRAREKIRLLGYVHRVLLTALLSQARALFFPSLYEGFGLPVVEAMQLGVPAMAGALGALPEIAGGAALLVDPFDVTAIARGIRQLDADSDLHTELSVAGLRNVTRFSDEACLDRLTSAYRAAGIRIPMQGGTRWPIKS